jgi:hypothetical protein
MSRKHDLACPRCKRKLDDLSWYNETGGLCRHCETGFEFIALPALEVPRKIAVARPAEQTVDSVCFFHAENRAEAVCESCGRLLCPICAIDFVGQRICPTCISASKTSESLLSVRERPLFDRIAFVCGLLSLTPAALVCCPAAIFFAFYGWKKPSSLVRGRSRTRFVVGALLGVVGFSGWILFFLFYVPLG